jgi:hypothetical protein
LPYFARTPCFYEYATTPCVFFFSEIGAVFFEEADLLYFKNNAAKKQIGRDCTCMRRPARLILAVNNKRAYF